MRVRCLAVLIPALVLALPLQAQEQEQESRSWRQELRKLQEAHHRSRQSVITRIPAPSARNPVVESEPNDSIATADSVSLGDRGTGVIVPDRDTDFWAVNLAAGQHFSVDVDASQVGSALDPTLALFSPDGRLLAFNDDFDGFDSRISFRIQTTGRYFVGVRGFARGGSANFTYAVNFGVVTCSGFGTEQEPDDSPATATPINLGRTGSGEICPRDENPAGDVDYWAFPVPSGTTIELDIDVTEFGVQIEPVVTVFASDGTTRLASSEDPGQPESRVHATIPTAGTYFASVASLTDPDGNPFPYILHFRELAQGPGDPITVRARDLGLPLGLAVGNTGDLFVGDLAGNRVMRISGNGAATPFATGIQSPEALAFDAFGFLLVTSGDGVVYRISPSGQVAPFITDAGAPFWIAVGPDGRIWLTDLLDQSLRRYSQTGLLEIRITAPDIGGLGPGPLAIAPSGEPYFSNGTEIWRFSSGRVQRIITGDEVIWGFAFDIAGNIYAPMPVAGRITLFDLAGNRLSDPFSVGPDTPEVVAFGRTETGTTVARLFATDLGTGRVIEMNPAGVRNPGQQAGFTALFTVSQAAASLLGKNALRAVDLLFLDDIGNHNGRYDVGDLQAYLRALGEISGTVPGLAEPRKEDR